MMVGVRHDDLRRRNRAMVISAVRRAAGEASRTAVAAETGLSHSTISAISSDLIAEGILNESRDAPPSLKRGRPQVGLALNARATSVLSVVLSLNFLSIAVIDYAGGVIAQEERRLDTQAMSREQLVAECVAIIRHRLDDPGFAGGKVARIVLAVQGTTDAAARTVLWSPITPQTDIAFAAILEEEFGIP
ncbi:MAG TPA: sugar kinase, partial [Mesorhizobium sp.]